MREDGRLWNLVVQARWGIGDIRGDSRDVTRPHGMGLWRKSERGNNNFRNASTRRC